MRINLRLKANHRSLRTNQKTRVSHVLEVKRKSRVNKELNCKIKNVLKLLNPDTKMSLIKILTKIPKLS